MRCGTTTQFKIQFISYTMLRKLTEIKLNSTLQPARWLKVGPIELVHGPRREEADGAVATLKLGFKVTDSKKFNLIQFKRKTGQKEHLDICIPLLQQITKTDRTRLMLMMMIEMSRYSPTAASANSVIPRALQCSAAA